VTCGSQTHATGVALILGQFQLQLQHRSKKCQEVMRRDSLLQTSTIRVSSSPLFPVTLRNSSSLLRMSSYTTIRSNDFDLSVPKFDCLAQTDRSFRRYTSNCRTIFSQKHELNARIITFVVIQKPKSIFLFSYQIKIIKVIRKNNVAGR
jgi:hypothetical protein